MSFFSSPSAGSDDTAEEAPTTPSANPSEASAGSEAPVSLNDLAKLLKLMGMQNKTKIQTTFNTYYKTQITLESSLYNSTEIGR